ncbi:hypothetical protein [Glycomyces sp. NRRL B-16210]|uniref:hypothetical protein n=1 Tax=Glycomyces sp. NRRL B-16210 TaxID=1463821 RepID=UPI001062244A|nr:hypothetical protein [Glycomyces sp. NRRL B-16210]
MSATPPFGPAYDEQPDDGSRSGPGQWRPRAGRPQGPQGEPLDGQRGAGQYQGEPQPPRGPQGQGGYGGQQPGRRPMPQAGRPSPEPRGGAPRAGGPSAGRGQQPNPYQSPQQHYSPQGGQEPPRSSQTGPLPGRPDPRSAPQRGGEFEPQASPPHVADEPFEETAFVDDRSQGDWSGGAETTAIGRLGYMPKEQRRRSDFQKVRSRARKSSPLPKILIGVVALALVGAATWWFVSRPSEEAAGTETAAGLTYAGSEAPCSLVDAAPLESVVNGTEPVESADGEQKSRGWVQSCSLTYGEPEKADALLEVEGTVFDTEAKASVNFELGTREIGDMGEAWTLVEPAPEIGDETAAVARVVAGGTSNYHLHIHDDNVYMVLRLSVAPGADLDEQGLTDLASQLAASYLENWRNAS